MTRTSWLVVAVALTAALLWVVTVWKTRDDGDHRADELEVELAPGAAPQPEAPAAPAPSPTVAAPVEPAAPSDVTRTEPTPAPGDPSQPPDETQLPPPEKSGPVDELKQQFASEPRDSGATVFEKQIETAFKSSDVPPQLLGSVLCHRTVCRVQTRWTPARAMGFMAAFTRLMMGPDGRPSGTFDGGIAVSPEGEADQHGELAVDVYLKRLTPEQQAAQREPQLEQQPEPDPQPER